MSAATRLEAEIEHMIVRLRGVISSRVVIHEGSVAEIHVLAGTGRPAKQMVRDIETALSAQFGLAVDHRKISVAQLDAPDEHAPKAARLVLQSLKAEITPASSIVQVSLQIGGEILHGQAEGPRTMQSRGRLAASATLHAIQSVLQTNGRLILDQHLHVAVGTRKICLVSILFSKATYEERLLGGAVVDSDHLEPAVKAVLMAVNRRLTQVIEPRMLVAN